MFSTKVTRAHKSGKLRRCKKHEAMFPPKKGKPDFRLFLVILFFFFQKHWATFSRLENHSRSRGEENEESGGGKDGMSPGSIIKRKKIHFRAFFNKKIEEKVALFPQPSKGGTFQRLRLDGLNPTPFVRLAHIKLNFTRMCVPSKKGILTFFSSVERTLRKRQP